MNFRAKFDLMFSHDISKSRVSCIFYWKTSRTIFSFVIALNGKFFWGLYVCHVSDVRRIAGKSGEEELKFAPLRAAKFNQNMAKVLLQTPPESLWGPLLTFLLQISLLQSINRSLKYPYRQFAPHLLTILHLLAET